MNIYTSHAEKFPLPLYKMKEPAKLITLVQFSSTCVCVSTDIQYYPVVFFECIRSVPMRVSCPSSVCDVVREESSGTFYIRKCSPTAAVALSCPRRGLVVAVVDGKATSAFPDKSIQNRLGSVRAARRARPSTLARYGIGRVFWMVSRRGRNRFVSR
jgi:hypothetical protein